mmetsp:Transcript_92085/g.269438  ORF Transcript_92085/g.269438 Transcript_92085/m.269438 type:complete len:373 (-) Transcript_92085:168-1286(-)
MAAPAESGTSSSLWALITCAWGRDDSPQPDSLLPFPPDMSEDVEAIVERMRNATADQSLQEVSCMRLEELALDASLKQRIAVCGGVDAIVSAMYAHPAALHLQEHACAALGNQAWEAADQRLALVDQGALRAVIMAMLQHPSDFRVQEEACWAIRSCCLIEDGRREIAECGGLQRILSAMQEHSTVAAILEHGCMILGYMAYESKPRKWIAYDGGVNVVLGSMEAQLHDSVIQEAACLALRNLGCGLEIRQAVLGLCGDEACLRAMSVHPACASLQEAACDALQVLRPEPQRLAELTAHELIVQAMKLHPASERLQAKACLLLAHMGGHEAGRRAITLAQGQDLAVLAKANFPSSGEVQGAAGKALGALGER